MFLSETHQPQLLDAECYFSDDRFQREKTSILDSVWHCVGSLEDVRNDGDFFTIELLGHPLLIRRDEGEIRAFLNVCAHRFCKLTHCDRGHAEIVKCQYHGWEYGVDGQTRRIPDAPSFKPLKKGELGLIRYRCQTRGQLVFVSLAKEGPDLAEQLGDCGDQIDQWFSADWGPMMSHSDLVACNWKTYLENGLESYHINTVHRKTLFQWPVAELCDHEFSEHATRFISAQEAPRTIDRYLDRWMHRRLRLDRQPYQHVHSYPTLTFIRMSMFSYFESVLPVSAGSTRVVTRGFVYLGARPTWRARLLSPVLARWGSRFLKRIQDEDVGILKLNQAGIRSPLRPLGGLISAREERIIHFQNYVRNAAGIQVAIHPPS